MKFFVVLLGVAGLAWFIVSRKQAATLAAAPPAAAPPDASDPRYNGSGNGDILNKGGILSVNSQLGIAEQTDKLGGTAICTYYAGGSAAPLCSKAAGYVSRFNAWQTKTTISVAKKGANAVGSTVGKGLSKLTSWI